jgi:hypothetical protein
MQLRKPKNRYGISKFELPNYGRVPHDSMPLPQVTFDPALGPVLAKRGEVIDFDTQRHAQYLASRGLSAESIKQTTIHFAAYRGLSATGGGYTQGDRLLGKPKKPDLNRIVVRIGPRTDEKEINARVAHESEHRLQDEQGMLGKAHKLRLAVRAGFQSMGYSYSGLGAALVGAYYGNPAEAPTGPIQAGVTLIAGFSGIVGTALDYRYSQVEREAFAVMPHALPLLTISPDPNHPANSLSLSELHSSGGFANYGSE